MNGKIYTQFVTTFLMGAVTGAFLFVTVFAPAYKKDLDTQEAEVTGVVIEGQMYGGCSEVDSCASFRLLQNSRYDYLPYPDTVVEHGRLPYDVAQQLFDSLSEEVLISTSVTHSSDSCSSHVDGLDFTYTVSTATSTYTLDTCSTKLAQDAALQASFVDAWDFMQNPTTTYPEILEEGVGEYIIEKTFERFHNSVPTQE